VSTNERAAALRGVPEFVFEAELRPEIERRFLAGEQQCSTYKHNDSYGMGGVWSPPIPSPFSPTNRSFSSS
jgi:hypothetical protein